MFHRIKNAAVSAARFVGNAIAGSRRNVATYGVAGAMLAPALAHAQATDLGSAATAALSGANDTVKGILITLVGIVFLFVLYSLIKKAKG